MNDENDVDDIWISIRTGWPLTENVVYDVKDCRYNVEGKAFYNGYDFTDVEWDVPKMGSLMLYEYIITHWGEKNVTT